MNGRFVELSRMSCIERVRTTESSVSRMNEQIWHLGSLHSGGLRLVKSEGRLAFPARCWRLTWYLLTVVKKDVTCGLAENPPLHNFWTA